MTVVSGPRPYEAMHDPAELRIIVGELRRVRQLIGQFTDVAAELPGVELAHVTAAKATTTAVVSLLIERAEARLRRLTAGQPPPAVEVFDPQCRPRRPLVGGTADATVSMLPMITRPAVATGGLCSAVLALAPGQASVPLVYPDGDTIIVVIFGELELVWQDAAGATHRVAQRRHQHAHIRRGTAHRMANPGAVPVTAVQIRATADLAMGVEQLPELAASLTTDLPANGRQPAGRPAIIAHLPETQG